MKSLMRLACLGAVAMAFVACEEDKHICTLPSFAGFRIEPTVWNAGDSVTITAVQQSLGDLLYKANTIGVWNVRIRLSQKIIMWCMTQINPTHTSVSGFRTIFAAGWLK